MDGFEIDELLGDSVWCRLVEFVVAYGFDAWSWQLSGLYQKLESTWVSLSRGKESNLSARLTKTLRQMSATQRVAWYELSALAKKLMTIEHKE